MRARGGAAAWDRNRAAGGGGAGAGGAVTAFVIDGTGARFAVVAPRECAISTVMEALVARGMDKRCCVVAGRAAGREWSSSQVLHGVPWWSVHRRR